MLKISAVGPVPLVFEAIAHVSAAIQANEVSWLVAGAGTSLAV